MSFFSRKTRPATSGRSPSRTFRPRLELLEDRSVPSAGALDPTFGSGGIVTTKVSTNEDTARAVALQTDGKVVVAGTAYLGAGYDSGAFAVLRYNANGSLDSSFGSGGKTITDIDSRKADGANAVAIDYSGGSLATNPNYGKIYAAGWASLGNPMFGAGAEDAAFALVRYNPNGTLDTTFGGSQAKGKVITNFTSGSEYAYGVAVQPNGKIVVTGVGSDIVLARYNANGILDGTFGNQGKVITDDGIATDAAVGDMVLQADGKIVVIGRGSVSGSGAYVSVLARYNGNGTRDNSFGTNGLVTTLDKRFGTVAVQPDGKLVAGGTNGVDESFHWAFARFETGGALDASFGTSGTVVTDTSGVARAVTLDAAGRIVAAGWTPGVGTDTALLRLNPDGSLDATFGTGGKVQTSISQFGDFASDVVIQTDGKIVTAGYFDSRATAGSPVDRDFALARYLPSSPQIGSFTASPNPLTAGSPVTLTASNVQALNPGSTITQVAFYMDSNNNGVLDSGDSLLGYGTQTSPGTWTFTFTFATSGTYKLFARAQDSYGVFSDPLALDLQVL